MEIKYGALDYEGMTRQEQIETIRSLIESYKDNIRTAQANLTRLEARLVELEDSKQMVLPMGPSSSDTLLEREKE